MPSLLEFVYWVVKKRTLSGQKIKKRHYYDDYFAYFMMIIMSGDEKRDTEKLRS